ncbi:MAG TPA: hypothetical protein VFM51_09410 [Solirubrobacterales bacterium]|nr:hypothetical protein [Solirubrobacterales bacterium]
MTRTLRLGHRGISDLLGIYGQVLHELNQRKVIRSANAPTGDYAEWLVQRALGGELQPNSNKSADLIVRRKKIQIKARVLSDPEKSGQRQLSPFRSWDFDDAVIVLFNHRYTVRRATRIKVDELKAAAREDRWVSGHRVIARDALLDRGRDITENLQDAAAMQDD